MLEPLVLMLALASGEELQLKFVDPPALVGGQERREPVFQPPPEGGGIFPREGSRMYMVILRGGKPVGGAQLVAVHLPGSEVEKVDEVGATREDGTIEWTPPWPGLVELTASLKRPGEEGKDIVNKTSKTISVRFEGLPWQGILVMLFAGGLLFGGMIISYRKLTSA